MAKTEILTKDGLVIYDGKMKNYIKDLTDDTVYIDPDEESTDIGDIESITSAKFVSYNNTTSGIEGTNVQEAIDEINETKVNTADIVDNLASTATNLPLSANQGKILNDNLMLNSNINLGYINITSNGSGTFTLDSQSAPNSYFLLIRSSNPAYYYLGLLMYNSSNAPILTKLAGVDTVIPSISGLTLTVTNTAIYTQSFYTLLSPIYKQ